MPARLFDPTPYSDFFGAGQAAEVVTYKDDEIGLRLQPAAIGTEIHGVRLYSAKTGAHTIRAKLWLPGETVTPEKNQDFSLSGAGYKELKWTDPHIVSAAEMGALAYTWDNDFVISLYDPDNVSHTYYTGTLYLPLSGRLTVGVGHGRTVENDNLRYSTGGEGRPNTGLSVGLPADPLTVPPVSSYEPTPAVDAYGADRTNIVAQSGSRTVGGRFWILSLGVIHGVRFYTHSAGPYTYKVTVWDPAGSVVATKTSGTSLAAGFHDIFFDTPYSITEADVQQTGTSSQWTVGVWETGGNVYTEVNPANDAFASRQWGWWCYHRQFSGHTDMYASGDAKPTSFGNDVPVAPLIAPVYG